nr:MAG TPA: protein of unknown function (DUF5548) [Caudoviricetes sp.]
MPCNVLNGKSGCAVSVWIHVQVCYALFNLGCMPE